jgi:hypothetical protein
VEEGGASSSSRKRHHHRKSSLHGDGGHREPEDHSEGEADPTLGQDGRDPDLRPVEGAAQVPGSAGLSARSMSCDADIAMGVSWSRVNPCRPFRSTSSLLSARTAFSCSRLGTGYSPPSIPVIPTVPDRGRSVVTPVFFNMAIIRAYCFSRSRVVKAHASDNFCCPSTCLIDSPNTDLYCLYSSEQVRLIWTHSRIFGFPNG